MSYEHCKPSTPTPHEVFEKLSQFQETILPLNMLAQQRNSARLSLQQPSRAKCIPSGMYVLKEKIPRTSKSEARYEGPFKVIRQTRANTYVLEDLLGTTLTTPVPHSQLVPIDYNPADESFEIDFIIRHEEAEGQTWYLVHWKNYDHRHDSWITAEMFDNPEVLQRYYRNLKDSSSSGGG
eukprot:Nk52_evm1s623 gene=Nk52_evmTU1s623